MTPYAKVKLKNMIEENGKVELTIVDVSGNVSEEVFTNYDEAVFEIQSLEDEHEVYF